MASVERYKTLPSRTNRKLRVTSSSLRRTLFNGISKKALLLEVQPRWALETEHNTLWELYEGNLEGGLHYWGPGRICQITLWKWASVSIGTPLGEHQGTLLSYDLRERGEVSCLSGELLLRNSRDMYKKTG